MCQRGNWIINLFVILCYLSTTISLPCTEQSNNTNQNLPKDWPCSWNDGVIPFVLDLFSVSPHRLINLVKKGHEFIEIRSCLRFKEYDPTIAAKITNFTYLYYTYSGVLESCCLKFYIKPYGRRLVVITPLCNKPAETGHATLHAMGLFHDNPTYEYFRVLLIHT
ncbi:unnamed protein product [Chilo suppressalis]|uniref:Peptidase M12A domain-containing protein n=1 Tax=Chilo suppressalis TaxID=168631 RepID=A0ABN8B0M9_CHISP|nr:unnamed protein product [Chilo suppressalis]